MTTEAGFERGAGGGAQGRRLAVILHGWTGSPATMADVREAVVEKMADAAGLDLFVPLLAHARLLSMTSPGRITVDLIDAMARICADPGTYRDIVLIGHSTGAVLARRLFLVAAGADALVKSEGELAGIPSQTWARKVNRIISLAGLNRGWVNSGRLGWALSLGAAFLGLVGPLLPQSKVPTVFHLRRGAPFIVTARLQWLAMGFDRNRRTPVVVQLLGTEDDLVAPDDAIDFAVDSEENGGYFYIELPRTDHGAATVFGPGKTDPDGTAGRERKCRFQAALTRDAAGLADIAVNPSYLIDTLPPAANWDVKDVVFVIHGIRDDAYWTRRIAQHIRAKAPQPETFRSLTPTYGYFAILPFVLWWVRREKVEWLMDQYVGAVAAFPEARFHYVGHSNGTYLLARGMNDCPGVRFDRVLFAGSVVRRDYKWKDRIEAGQVRQAFNMVATADWVVALFPTGLETWRVFDLGGGGFGGFRSSAISQMRYVTGDHSAALVESQWPVIADYIVSGTEPHRPNSDYAETQSLPWRLASMAATVGLVPLIAVLLAWPGWVLWHQLPCLSGSGGAALMAGIVLYYAVLKLVLQRF